MASKTEYLRELGLSNYEIEVYLLLLKVRQAKAKSISNESKVPYGRIYDVLYSLQQKGLISVISSKPKIYEAVEPQKSVANLLERQKNELKKLEEDKKNIVEQLIVSDAYAPSKQVGEKINIYYGSDNAIKLGIVGIQKSKKELLINTTRLEDPMAQKLIAKKILEGVKVKVMIPNITEKNKKNIKRIIELGGEVKVGGIDGMKLGISDSVGTLITVASPENLKGHITIVIEGRHFGSSMRKFFNIYWDMAKSL